MIGDPIRIAAFLGFACWLTTSLAADQPRQLTRDGRLKRDPVFIQGGEQIVYAGQADSPQLVLYRLSLADGRRERLHPESGLPEFRPCYSANQTAMSFLQMTGNDVLQLHVTWPLQQRSLAIPASKNTVWHGAIAPDGEEVVYSAAGQIFAQFIEGGQPRQLTQSAGSNNHPAISPDGRQIAFSSSRDGNYELYAMQRDGSQARRLTHAPGMDIRPAWSADGQWLAFSTARHGDYEIYAIRSDGSDVTRITDHPERDDFASWHPAGTHLVVVTEHDGATDLFLVPFR